MKMGKDRREFFVKLGIGGGFAALAAQGLASLRSLVPNRPSRVSGNSRLTWLLAVTQTCCCSRSSAGTHETCSFLRLWIVASTSAPRMLAPKVARIVSSVSSSSSWRRS